MSLGVMNHTLFWITLLLALFVSPADLQRFPFRKKITRVVLSGGRVPSEGNVLVATNDDRELRPLCDDFFWMAEANAVCMKLGYPRALRFTRLDYFGKNRSSYRWSPEGWKSMSILDCPRSNNSIAIQSCTITDNREDACTPAEVAGVVCRTEATTDSRCSSNDFVCERDIQGSTSSSSSSSSPCIQETALCDGSLDCSDGSDEKLQFCDADDEYRLESNILTSLPGNTVAGTVYMKHRGTWATVCRSNFDNVKAQIICRNLGYGGGMSVAFFKSYFGGGTGLSHRNRYTCRGFETSLSQCPGFFWPDNLCKHSLDVGVFCHTGNFIEVNLVDGTTRASGRLEISSSSLASPAAICDAGFDDLDARVVCRMLGYEGTRVAAHKGSPFGMGSGDLWNIILNCKGNENSIQECQIRISDKECTHRNTAAVTCAREKSAEEVVRHVFPADCGEAVDASDRFLTNVAKIRGGKIPSRFDVPWLAALNIRNGDEGYVLKCGAVVISEYYLLSAAHCFSTYGKLNYRVSVGNFNNKHDEHSQQDFLMDKVWLHEDYEELGIFDNDIALIKVQAVNGRGMRLGDRVKAICLPQPGDSYQDLRSCVVSGWGRTSSSSVATTYPRTLKIEAVPGIVCERLYGSRSFTSSQSCFGNSTDANACKGDSGGPLTCNGPQGRQVLYGLPSSGSRCRPNMVLSKQFVRVTKYLRWIQEMIAQDLHTN